MEVTITQSIQQTTYDQFHKLIKENSSNKSDIVKTISEILENQFINTYSDFLQLTEIDEVIKLRLV